MYSSVPRKFLRENLKPSVSSASGWQTFALTLGLTCLGVSEADYWKFKCKIFIHEVICPIIPARYYFYYQHLHRDIGWKVQVISPFSMLQIKLATSLICMHTQNLYFINKYFQLCKSGTEEEDCNICEQNQVSLDTPSENQPR